MVDRTSPLHVVAAPHERFSAAQTKAILESIEASLDTLINFADKRGAEGGSDAYDWHMASYAAERTRLMTIVLTSANPAKDIETELFGRRFHE